MQTAGAQLINYVWRSLGREFPPLAEISPDSSNRRCMAALGHARGCIGAARQLAMITPTDHRTQPYSTVKIILAEVSKLCSGGDNEPQQMSLEALRRFRSCHFFTEVVRSTFNKPFPTPIPGLEISVSQDIWRQRKASISAIIAVDHCLDRL